VTITPVRHEIFESRSPHFAITAASNLMPSMSISRVLKTCEAGNEVDVPVEALEFRPIHDIPGLISSYWARRGLDRKKL